MTFIASLFYVLKLKFTNIRLFEFHSNLDNLKKKKKK